MYSPLLRVNHPSWNSTSPYTSLSSICLTLVTIQTLHCFYPFLHSSSPFVLCSILVLYSSFPPFWFFILPFPIYSSIQVIYSSFLNSRSPFFIILSYIQVLHSPLPYSLLNSSPPLSPS